MDSRTVPPTTSRRVVAIPYPGRGHINPMLNFCQLLASRARDVQVTVIVTEEWLGLIGAANENPAMKENMCFVTIPNVLPSEKVRGADLAGFMEAVLEKMEEPVERVLERIEKPVAAMIADSFVPWAVGLGRKWSAPVASFWSPSVSCFTMFFHYHLLVNHRHYPVDPSGGGEEARIDYIPGIPSIRISDLPNAFRANKQRYLRVILQVISTATKARCLVFRSIRKLEPCPIDALSSILPIPIYPVGPAIPYPKLSGPFPDPSYDYLQWLNSQARSSVLYVSLGSYLSTSPGQMEELAAGLRDSRVPFLWVAKDTSSSFKDRLIIPWCDQLKVLTHPSVGGFLTHCGWNSCLESAFAGVPVLTFPLSADQPVNRKVVVEDWQTGWRMEGTGEAGTVVGRKEIAETVKRFMDLESPNRVKLGAQARELREKSRLAVAEDGVSEANFNAFLSEFLRC
ncbi:hypothetical protein Nepgr_027691 [Nepenthes gracilis]|uniref:Glycosyltransferase n=1 Tax=Nepenthes gracilis TaxID=150966 RepID=A0AAD3T995_NEPGR|nr:hypothetical protein Nepgr_027691 [Nepenthes gracilis]